MNSRASVILLIVGLLCGCPGAGDPTRYDDLNRRPPLFPDGATTDDQGPLACGRGCTGCCLPSGICAGGETAAECGAQGYPCIDCAATKQACAAGACADCTPSCANKTCGADDGCGDPCPATSGCCSPACANKPCNADDGCGNPCAAGSGCLTDNCSWGTSGDHGDSCTGIPAETWRCVDSAKWSTKISQVCRDGIWQTFHVNPVACWACCGTYDPGCQ